MQHIGQQAVVQLQPRGADALVLPRVDIARGGTRGVVSALYDGRQSLALAAHSGAVRKGVQRDILPAVHPGRVDGGEGTHLRLLHAAGVLRSRAGEAVGAGADLHRLRDGESDELWTVGAQGRRVVPGAGVLLRFAQRGTAEDGRGVCGGP